MSREDLEKRFGQSSVFLDSTLMENGGVPQSTTPETLLKEAIHVISCGYEDKSEWGTEVRCYLMLNNILFYVERHFRSKVCVRTANAVTFNHFHFLKLLSVSTRMNKKKTKEVHALFSVSMCPCLCHCFIDNI